MSVGLFNSFAVEADGGSGGCSDWVCCQAFLPMTVCYDEEGNPWYGDEKRCSTDSCT